MSIQLGTIDLCYSTHANARKSYISMTKLAIYTLVLSNQIHYLRPEIALNRPSKAQIIFSKPLSDLKFPFFAISKDYLP